MSTQADIHTIVDEIVRIYDTQLIAFPNGNYRGQCSVVVAYYVERLTGEVAPHMANDRADGWGTNFPAELGFSFRHERYQPGKAYPKGTILIWNSPHIAIVLSSNGGATVAVFEQNADPDGSPCHSAIRTVNNQFHTCTFALLPIVNDPIPIVSPAPIIPLPPPPPPAPPFAPVAAPSTDKYGVLVAVPGYTTSNQAANRLNSSTTVSNGLYFVYNRAHGMLNVTRDPRYPGSWINPADNVLRPPPPLAPAIPTPIVSPSLQDVLDPSVNWRGTLNPAITGYYVSMNTFMVHDLENKQPDKQIKRYDIVEIAGTFTKDGNQYGRVKNDKFFWYGIPWEQLVRYTDWNKQTYSTTTTLADRQALHTLRFDDYVKLSLQNISKTWDSIFRKK